MSAKHRKSARRAAARAATAAGAIAATAGLAMATPQVANAAAPDYASDIGNLSQALDNFLNGADTTQQVIQAPWNSLAGQAGGLLPTFDSDFNKYDATDITNIGDLLISLGSITLPTGVPGVVPDITIPGSTTPIDIGSMLPGTIPGGSVLVELGTTINGVLGTQVGTQTVGEILGTAVPPLSHIVDGLIATHTDYSTSYDWSLLGMSGITNVDNTFIQTPSGLILDLTSIPALDPITTILSGLANTPGGALSWLDPSAFQLLQEDSLPNGTVWIPQADGNYQFPLGASAGWWAAMPTADLKFPTAYPAPLGGTQTVISAPITAAGIQGPLDLFKAGTIGANILLPTDNGVYSPLGLNMWNLGLPLGFSVTNLNITTDNYVGTNGINVNNGQNLMLIQNPIFPIPLVYSLGGFNMGPSGAGITLPSLFGVSLMPKLQLGVAPGTGNAGLIPAGWLSTAIPDLSDVSGIIPGLTLPTTLTGILGLDPLIQQGIGILDPLYTIPAGIFLQPISDFATEQYGPFMDGMSSGLLSLSEQGLGFANQLPGAVPNEDPTTDNQNAPTPPAPLMAPQGSAPQALRVSDDSPSIAGQSGGAEGNQQHENQQPNPGTEAKHRPNGITEPWSAMADRLGLGEPDDQTQEDATLTTDTTIGNTAGGEENGSTGGDPSSTAGNGGEAPGTGAGPGAEPNSTPDATLAPEQTPDTADQQVTDFTSTDITDTIIDSTDSTSETEASAPAE